MTIYGVSQSSGVERRLQIEPGARGVVLILLDHVGGKERARILVPADPLLASIIEPTPGGTPVEGIFPPHGPNLTLSVEVRRNEVLLNVSATAGDGTDVAVGLDDLQDALEGILSRG
jgi:hypothetical protein